MDDELLMKLADHGSPEALADCIIEHYPGIQIPIPVERIAEDVGIVEIIGKQTETWEGVLVTDNDKKRGSIAFNKSSRIERRRFTIAHELGHFLCPWHGANAQCGKAELGILKSKDPNRAHEAEANRFAASLLMPRKLFLRDIGRLGPPETEHIVRLHARYRVSKEAAARRYTELSDRACAVVFSRHGSLRNFCMTESFPYIAIAKDAPLPATSISIRSTADPGQMSEWSETDPALWLNESSRLRGKTLYEQFLRQADGYGLTMLTLDEAIDDEGPDEDSELEESWAVRFRR